MRASVSMGKRQTSVLDGVITLVFLSTFVFFSLGIVAVGVFHLINSNKSSGSYEKTTATISDIEIIPDSDGDGYSYEVYVDLSMYRSREVVDLTRDVNSESYYS